MTNAIRELPQPVTSVPHNDSTNSNHISDNAATTDYITKLLDLYKRGIYHTESGDCLPSCITYKSELLCHPKKFTKILSYKEETWGSFPMYPEAGTKKAITSRCNTYPEHIILQKKKLDIQIFFIKIQNAFAGIDDAPAIILKDYARQSLSPNKRAKTIKKLEKTIKQLITEKPLLAETPCCQNNNILPSYTYQIAHCEQQLRLLQLIEENPDKPPETQ